MRYAKKIDDNQKAIVKALREIGCFVQSLASIGKGCPDLIVAFRGKWFLMELKDGKKPPSAQKLSPDEIDWILSAAQKADVHLVRSEEEAIAVVTCGWLKQ